MCNKWQKLSQNTFFSLNLLHNSKKSSTFAGANREPDSLNGARPAKPLEQDNKYSSMKKKFFLIGALVAISLSVTFIACADAPLIGCECSVRLADGQSTTPLMFTRQEMKDQYGVSSCVDLSMSLFDQFPGGTVNCVAY